MKWFVTISVLIFLASLQISCHKNESPELKFSGYQYYPLKKGSWIIYRVDSTSYTPFGTDSSSWLLKEVVDTLFTDESGNLNARLHRYRSTVEQPSWNSAPVVWSALLSTVTAEKVEDNIRIIKLKFPVEKGLKWNGNLYNSEPEQIFTCKETDIGGNIGNFVFDSLLIVNQQDFSTLISRDFCEEIYAVGIGCISIQKVHLANMLAAKTGYTYNAVIVDWSL